jgi:hypothetical protein
VTFKYDADDNSTSANASFSSVTIKDVRGTITIKATLKVALTYDARNDTFKLFGSDSFTSISSVEEDRSKWSLSVATVSSYSYDSATDKGTSSRSETFTGFSTSDSLGNSAALNGKIAYSAKDDDYTGFFTSASFKIAGSTFSASGLKLLCSDILKNMLSGARLPIFCRFC